MPSFFICPTAPLVPMTSPARPNPADDLFRHYRPWTAGINVYLMPGGVLTTVEPERESDAVRVFHGGHIHPVDDATAGLLVAAGYTVANLPAAVQDGPLPGFDSLLPQEFGGGLYGDGLYGGQPSSTVDGLPGFTDVTTSPTSPTFGLSNYYDDAVFDSARLA